MSKKKVRYMAGGVLAVALMGAALFAWTRTGGVKWPQFPQSKDAPVAVADLLPDFSWRTGDVIPATVYIKEVPGAVCDLKSVVVKGDAQLRSVQTYTEDQPDGTRLIRVKLELQIFVLKPVWNVTPYITYRSGDKQERLLLELPAFEIGSSNTYDHRKIERVLPNGQKIEMKDGHPKDQPAVFLTSYAWLSDVGFGTLALMVIVVSGWVIVRREKKSKSTADARLIVTFSDEWQDTVKDVQAAVQLLMDGNTDVATYIRVQKGLQRLYRLDSVALPEIEAAADAGCNQLCSLRHILEFCHQVIYGRAVNGLERQEVETIHELLPEALAAAPLFKGLSFATGQATFMEETA